MASHAASSSGVSGPSCSAAAVFCSISSNVAIPGMASVQVLFCRMYRMASVPSVMLPPASGFIAMTPTFCAAARSINASPWLSTILYGNMMVSISG